MIGNEDAGKDRTCQIYPFAGWTARFVIDIVVIDIVVIDITDIDITVIDITAMDITVIDIAVIKPYADCLKPTREIQGIVGTVR